MERGSIIKDLILIENKIWTVPHVVQEMRRRDLRWDEFTRVYIADLAFGATQRDWIQKLLEEGNIGLSQEVMHLNGLESQFASLLAQKQQDWLEIYQYAIRELNEALDDKAEQITVEEKNQFLEMLQQANDYAQDQSYGDAFNTADSALKLLVKFILNRKKLLEDTYQIASKRIQEIGLKIMETPESKFPGGWEMLERARRLYEMTNAALMRRDFAKAYDICNLINDLLNGISETSNSLEIEVVSNHDPSQPPVFLESNNFEESEITQKQFEFERIWTDEDDDYLIDNYDVMTNEQLKSRYISTANEIEKRIDYLGLMMDRQKRKRMPWKNPYVAGKPIKSDKVFVGRDDVFEFIYDTLGANTEIEDKNLCALIGHRRTGKTSLLLQLKGKKRGILSPKIPVFVDIEGILPLHAKFPTQNFFWKMASFVTDELTDFGIEIVCPLEIEFTDPAMRFREFLKDAVKATNNRGLVIMIDEFQAIEPRQSMLNVDIYHMLRHIIQHSSGIDFIISGTLEVQRLMREYKAAMFGSAVTKRIDFLDERGARKLIVSPVNSYITYMKEAVDAIIQLTACHPYFVQLVCLTLTSYLIDRGKSKVFIHDVERIIPQVLERGVHFDEIWATDMQDMEKLFMAIVGELLGGTDEWCYINDVEDRLRREGIYPKDENRIVESIERLETRRILKVSDDGKRIRFYVTVFGKWVSTNKPLGVVRRDLQKEAAIINRRAEREPLSS